MTSIDAGPSGGGERRQRGLRSGWRTVALFAATLPLGACGGDAPEPQEQVSGEDQAPVAVAPPAGPDDACALLTTDDVAAVVGEAVRDSLALHMPGDGGPMALSQCNYATEQNPAVVSLMLRPPGPGETAMRASESVRETFAESNIPVEDVAGLGEVAFWAGNQLHTFTGAGWYLIVSTSGGAGVEQARPLMETAVAKLP